MKKTLIILFFIAIISCGEETKEPITLRIFSYFESFSGSYVVDNGDSIALASESYDTRTGKKIFFSEYHLGSLSTLSVTVTTNGNIQFLAIRIYKNTKKVKEATSTNSTTLSLVYDYEE